MKPDTVEYRATVNKLGAALREKLPEYNFSFDTQGDFFICNDLSLFAKFDNPEQWQEFLGIPEAMPYFDDGIFGFYISTSYMEW